MVAMDDHHQIGVAKVLLRAVEKEGLTLAGSVGVGDTESDIAFLKMVAKRKALLEYLAKGDTQKLQELRKQLGIKK